MLKQIDKKCYNLNTINLLASYNKEGNTSFCTKITKAVFVNQKISRSKIILFTDDFFIAKKRSIGSKKKVLSGKANEFEIKKLK